jgi:N,N'-diacetyllegionaminate synthase
LSETDNLEQCKIVAEIAQAHDGSLGSAHNLMVAAKKMGADAVKFQVHIADAESTKEDLWRSKFSYQDGSRFDYWKRMEFTATQWAGLRDHAFELDLQFGCSPFSLEAVDMMLPLRPNYWKIASGEVLNFPLLERLVATGDTIHVSNGLVCEEEFDATVAQISSSGNPIVVFHCTSEYPCPPENIELARIPYLIDRYKVPVGLSDHSGSVFSGLAAVSLGATYLEVHVAFSRLAFGPDTAASLTFDQLQQLRAGVDFIQTAKSARQDRTSLSKSVLATRQLFGRSLVASADLPKGHIIESSDLSYKKPGGGLTWQQKDSLIGKRLRCSIARDQRFTLESTESENA